MAESSPDHRRRSTATDRLTLRRSGRNTPQRPRLHGVPVAGLLGLALGSLRGRARATRTSRRRPRALDSDLGGDERIDLARQLIEQVQLPPRNRRGRTGGARQRASRVAASPRGLARDDRPWRRQRLAGHRRDAVGHDVEQAPHPDAGRKAIVVPPPHAAEQRIDERRLRGTEHGTKTKGMGQAAHRFTWERPPAIASAMPTPRPRDLASLPAPPDPRLAIRLGSPRKGSPLEGRAAGVGHSTAARACSSWPR